MNLYLILAVFFILSAVLLMLVQLLYGKGKGIKKEKSNKGVSVLKLNLYQKLSKLFLTREIIYQIRSRVEIVGVLNERTIRKRVVEIFLALFILVFSVFILVFLISKSLLMMFIAGVLLWLCFEVFIEIYVNRVKNKLLRDQLKLNDLIRHEYFNSMMVDEAIYLSCSKLSEKEHEIFIQGQKIYDVLVSKDVEKSIIEYNEVAANKYLKMLLGLSYMTLEYGDSKEDGKSVFLKNLGELSAEICIELSKRERINRGLFSLNFIALLPILFINPISSWASKYFLPLEVFYQSRTGIALKLLSILFVFVGFLGLRTLSNFNKKNYAENSKKFLEKIYKKYLRNLVDYIGALKNKRQYDNINKRLGGVLSKHSPETFITEKILSFILALVAVLFILISINLSEINRVKTEGSLPEHFLGGSLSEEEEKLSIEISRQDNILLENMNRAWTKEMIISSLDGEKLSDVQKEIKAERLYKKKEILYGYRLDWKDVLIAILIASSFYFLPDVTLLYRKKILRLEIEDEIAGFDSIIAMLMSHSSLTVLDVLEWMEMYAKVFKGEISDCINEYSSGSDKAFLNLAKVSNNERFRRIISSLITASDDLSLKEAFYELESDKQYYLEQRKILNEEIIEKKINMGKVFGFLPVYSLIVFYMVLPMIIVSLGDMNKYFNQLKI